MTEPRPTPANAADAADTELRNKLILETSRLPWEELQRHYAAGAVVVVSDTLDLIEVAMQISRDNTEAVSQWMANNLVGKVSDAQAKNWHDSDAVLWAVVVKPWVLVQYAKPAQQAPQGATLH